MEKSVPDIHLILFTISDMSNSSGSFLRLTPLEFKETHRHVSERNEYLKLLYLFKPKFKNGLGDLRKYTRS